MNSLPREVRRVGCQARRIATDFLSGRSARFVKLTNKNSKNEHFPIQLTLEQPILQVDQVQAKVHNIGIAIELLENVVAMPQQILSFWRLVGPAKQNRGFQPGRSLLGGEIVPDYGGGLCQLSGILYHLSLQAGLQILERHGHSIDIYNNRGRYTPLGADATVTWGFKDLRVLNTLDIPICFRFELRPDRLVAHLCASKTIEKFLVEFRATDLDRKCLVETRRKNYNQERFETLNSSTYKIPSEDP